MVRYISSPVWSNTSQPVLTENLAEATWLNNPEYNDGYPEPCNLYSYARAHGVVGCKHPGMDITMSAGTPLYAIEGGHIYWIRNAGEPNRIEVRVTTPQGHRHLYNHLQSSAVSVGDDVSEGQLVGYSGIANSPHLHFELRVPDGTTDSGMRIADPEPLLIGGGTPPAPSFDPLDLIQVTNGPLNLRATPSTSGAVRQTLATGTRLCVFSAPTSADGYTWYPVVIEGTQDGGYVAGEFCGLLAAGGCQSAPTFAPTDLIEVADGPLNLRAGASTSSDVRRSLATGTNLCVIFEPTEADGYTWYPVGVQGTQDAGYVAGEFCRLLAAGGCA